jgi:hypothetical protein
LSFWINILKLLGPEEVEIFDKWGFDNIEHNYDGEGYLSLTEYVQNLKNAGYL